jgi:hypothetical protein
VKEISGDLLGYFEKNWIPCKDHWSNVGRASAFSCGNTTTNRVESNWTQIKATIGDKTGIDKCVSALIQHQIAVYSGVEVALARFTASTRTNIGVPSFLRRIAAVLSDFALSRVQQQWCYF